MASSSKSKSKVCPFDHVEGRAYNCRNCRLYIASEAEKFTTVSEAFEAANPEQADLFERISAMNVIYGVPRDEIIEGMAFRGTFVYCANCHSTIGWKYVSAPPGPENYRQGKVQLQRDRVTGSHDA